MDCDEHPISCHLLTPDLVITALMGAAMNGHYQVTRELLAAGANPFLKNDFGETALDCAEMKGHTEIAALLRSHMQVCAVRV